MQSLQRRVPAHYHGDSFTYFSNGVREGFPESTRIGMAKDVGLNTGHRRRLANGDLSDRNKSQEKQIARVNRTEVDWQDQQLHATRNLNDRQDSAGPQDDSLFITTLRNKSRSSARDLPETSELVSTEKQVTARSQTRAVASFVQTARSFTGFPLPPRVKLRPIQTVRLVGDQQQCKADTPPSPSDADNFFHRRAVFDSGLVREKKSDRVEARYSIELNPDTHATITRVKGFTLPRISHGASQGSNSRSPFSRTSLPQSARSGCSLLRPVASAYRDPEDDDDDYVGDGIESTSQVEIVDIDEEDDSDTIRERFSEYSDDMTEPPVCGNIYCAELVDKLAEKDTLINSLHDHITTLKVLTTEQQEQILNLRNQVIVSQANDGGGQQNNRTLTIETEPAQTDLELVEVKETPKERVINQQSFQKSARTLLRKIKDEKVGSQSGHLQQLPDLQEHLYQRLEELLEKCLIVDTFNHDLDRSLESYVGAIDDDESIDGTTQNNEINKKRRVDLFFLSQQQHSKKRTSSNNRAFDQNMAKNLSTTHKRNETVLRRDAHVVLEASASAEQDIQISSIRRPQMTFGGNKAKSAGNLRFGVSPKDGSSSETTTRNLRYHQKQESDQSMSISQNQLLGVLGSASKLAESPRIEDIEVSAEDSCSIILQQPKSSAMFKLTAEWQHK